MLHFQREDNKKWKFIDDFLKSSTLSTKTTQNEIQLSLLKGHAPLRGKMIAKLWKNIDGFLLQNHLVFAKLIKLGPEQSWKDRI